MGRYGKIDESFGGGNLYRLIWAESRKVTLVCETGTYTLPHYVAVEPLRNPKVWILEKWLPPDQITALTAEEWTADPDCIAQGPYPARGDYAMAALPLTCDPSQANIDKLVQWVEAGRKRTRGQNAVAIQNEVDAKEKTRDRKRRDMIDNQLLPYGGEAYVGSGRAKRGTKTVSPQYSANDLGLPTKSGYSGVSPVHRPVTYEVPLSD